MIKKSKGKAYPGLTTILVSLFISAVFWMLPGGSIVTSIGMKVIGVFIATVLLLSFVNPIWPALLAAALLSRTGVASLSEIIGASFGNWIFYFIFLSFLMTYALNESGFTDRVVAKFISLPIARKSPWMFTFSLATISLLIGAFIDQCPAIAFVLSFAERLYKELGYDRDDSYPHMTNILITFAVIIGGAMTPISHTFALLGMGIYEGATGSPITLVQYLAFGVPTGLVLYVILLAVCRLFCRPDFSRFEDFDVNRLVGTRQKMTVKEKTVVICFFGAVLMWVLPGIAKMFTDAAWVERLNGYGITFWAILAVVIMSVVRTDGKPVLDIREAVNRHVDWGILVFVSIAIYLGTALSAGSTGVTEAITSLVRPLLDTMSPTMVVLMLTTIGVFLTNFASNVTTITVMTGVGVAIALGSGGSIHPAGMALCTTMAGSCAYFLPSSFAGIALLHSNPYSSRNMILKYGFLMMCVSSVAIGMVGYFVGCAIMH